MKILTSRFGEQEIEGSKIIEIADGLVGFSEERYILLHPDNGPFCWLQAVNNPGLAFVVVDPTNFVPDYKVKLTQDFRNFDFVSPWEAMTTLPGDEKVHTERAEEAKAKG